MVRSSFDKVCKCLRELSLQEEPISGREAKPRSIWETRGLSFVIEPLPWNPIEGTCDIIRKELAWQPEGFLLYHRADVKLWVRSVFCARLKYSEGVTIT